VPLKVEVVSADRIWWEGEADAVAVPASDGDMGVLPGHQPVLAVMRPGTIRVTTSAAGDRVEMDVTGGFLSVDDDQVTVVVDPSTSGHDADQSSTDAPDAAQG